VGILPPVEQPPELPRALIGVRQPFSPALLASAVRDLGDAALAAWESLGRGLVLADVRAWLTPRVPPAYARLVFGDVPIRVAALDSSQREPESSAGEKEEG